MIPLPLSVTLPPFQSQVQPAKTGRLRHFVHRLAVHVHARLDVVELALVRAPKLRLIDGGVQLHRRASIGGNLRRGGQGGHFLAIGIDDLCANFACAAVAEVFRSSTRMFRSADLSETFFGSDRRRAPRSRSGRYGPAKS